MNRMDLMQPLITIGADLNIKNKIGSNALMVAARKGFAHIVKTLAMAGADLNATDPHLTNALIIACVKKHVKVVQVLIEMLQNGRHLDLDMQEKSGIFECIYIYILIY